MSGFQRLTILYAEDERLLAEIVCEILEERGHDVHHFPDGAAAAAAVRDGLSFDVLLTDCDMPKMDGIELARQVRHLHPCLPIVMMTGNGGDALPARLRTLPGDEARLILKPSPIMYAVQVVESAALPQVSLAA